MNHLGFESDKSENTFGWLRKLGITTELAKVLGGMQAYTSILEAYQEGILYNPDLCMIIDKRNFIQHSLLSLPVTQGYWAYDICRIATLIYGVGVVFPLPASTAPFTSLVSLLQAGLQNSMAYVTEFSPDVVNFFVWAIVMGGIAASALPERTWYIAELAKITSYAHLACWADAKRSLKMILWSDIACETSGARLWEEMVHFMSQHNELNMVRMGGSHDVPPDPSAVQKTKPPCIRCRRKKIKCNRKFPCQSCVKVGSTCSYRKNVGEEVESSTEFRDKIAYLEAQLGYVLNYPPATLAIPKGSIN
jgi:hypothetical protein